MPLKLRNAAALSPKTSETVEAVGITIPVYPYLTTAEKLTFASLGEDTSGPLFILRAFSVFTKWRCEAVDHVELDELANADLERDEIGAIATAVSRLFAATRENEPEGDGEGKVKRTRS